MRGLLVAGVAAVVVACAAGAARADVASIVNDGADPSAGGVAVTTPLEAATGAIASKVAGRAVGVRCEGDPDWTQLAAANGFPPASVLGFVSFLDAQPLDFTELSPGVCRSLEAFAAAPAKPTKCALTTTVPRVVRNRVKGRVVRRTLFVAVTQPAAPCFAGGRELTADGPFWRAYFYTAEALQTLVHESVHLQGDPIEAEAECYGMQWLSYAAQQLGDTPDDAQSIAQYYATRLYPQRRTQAPDYWSPECRPNGALDRTPNDGVWP